MLRQISIARNVSAIAATTTRPRGLAAWNPRGKTLELLAQIDTVLDEYRDHLPLTIRQVYYRLVASFGYPKDQRGYDRLCETLNRARRSGRIGFEAIRDDGGSQRGGGGFTGKADFLRAVRHSATLYTRDGLEGQERRAELWCEAAGMVPQLERIAAPFGVPVYSSGGFESLTEKYRAALRFLAEDRPVAVLHVGDHDPSGVSLFNALNEDVTQMYADLDGDADISFVRVAITPAQIAMYGLPQAPAKASDRRGAWEGGTVQAEAFAPDTLAEIVRRAVSLHIDLDVLSRIRSREERERAELIAHIDRMLAAEGSAR